MLSAANVVLKHNKPITTIPKIFFIYKILHGIYTRYILKFFEDQHIGGYDDIRALEKENKLQDLLR
jgi:hypothetical protein